MYSEYEERVQENIAAGHHLEAMALAAICLDVLLHLMVDGLSRYHKMGLDTHQLETLRLLCKGQRTAGRIIDCLQKHQIIEPCLVEVLRNLNENRNRVIHPFSGTALKPNAIVPRRGETRKSANRFSRDLSKLIELAGGFSLRERRAEHRRYLQTRNRVRSRLRAA